MPRCHLAARLLPPSLIAAACVLPAAPVAADAELGEVRVSAVGEKPRRAISLQAGALPAAVTVIGREEIERTNVGRDYSDLLRRVPGINAYGFGQGDIGSPVKMRGFTGTGAHGADVAIHVDGVPQNLPSASQGGPGMSDLSWLTPEMIERIEVIKGPFSALYGDQNRAGAINIVTRGGGESSVGLSVGSHGTARGTLVAAGGDGAAPDGVRTFAVADIYGSDGYRDNSESARGAFFGKASLRVGEALWALRANYYRADWKAPGYLRYADLLSGAVAPSARDPYAPPLWGDAERFGLVLTRAPARGEEGLRATAYVEHYDKSRANPVGGNVNALNVQSDRRAIAGGRLLYNHAFSPRAALAVGAELRSDRGSGINRRWDTSAGPGATYLSYWDLDLLSYGVFAQGQYRLLDDLKLVGGLRADAFDYRIDNRKLPAASLDYRASVTTPRAGFVWSPLPTLNIYANIGEGFRAPAERELSPAGTPGPLGATGGGATAGLAPPKVKARDLGFDALLGARWKLSASAYRSQNRNEIRETTPGSGVYAGVGDTTRNGWEADLRFFASDALGLYGSYGRVKGRIDTPLVAGQTLIAGLPEHTWRLGAEYAVPHAGGTLFLNGDAFYLSGAPYYSGTDPGPLFSRPYTRYDLRATFAQGRWRYTAWGTFQPRDFASEQAGSTLDPRPKAELGLGAVYRF
ncbi:MAG: outer membrane receptor protein [Candidatus Accumulibacter sp. 66-26]|nr:TonB-dependent receptor [Accumulibacter sp.]OJW48907.1 MAG: outer membrane receptor protein [Candidatus Accumulibacter sp. 66-26]